MKTKTTILALLMTAFSYGQTLVNYTESPYITSFVWKDGSTYHYQYKADSKINNREISNITIDLCDSRELYDVYGDDSYKLEYKDNVIKFDNINPRGDEFIFGFYTMNSPELGDANIKASTQTYTNQIWTPSCQIPEPSYILISSIGTFFLFKRRR
jgi:hypothetical protein